MTYQTKKTLTNMVAMTILLAAYCLYAFPRYSSADELRVWAVTMLIFMGIGMLAMVVIQVLFHIFFAVGVAIREAVQDGDVDEDTIESSINVEMIEDERDQLISSKSSRISTIVSGIGFIAGLVSLVLGHPPSMMLNTIFISFFISSIAEEAARIVLYRWGINHG